MYPSIQFSWAIVLMDEGQTGGLASSALSAYNWAMLSHAAQQTVSPCDVYIMGVSISRLGSFSHTATMSHSDTTLIMRQTQASLSEFVYVDPKQICPFHLLLILLTVCPGIHYHESGLLPHISPLDL